MSVKGQLRDALSLWVPAGGENIDDMIANLNAGRQAIDDFLDGKLPPREFLEALAAENVDIDSYGEIIEDNLSSIRPALGF